MSAQSIGTRQSWTWKLKTPDIVMNTGPVIAPTAAVGSLDFLSSLYREILLPREVYLELEAGGTGCTELRAVNALPVFAVETDFIDLPALLISQLDVGEASVVQSAIQKNVPVVAIDEKAGRRIARLNKLKVTGSLGILVKASKQGLVDDLEECFSRMRERGVWISQKLIDSALNHA